MENSRTWTSAATDAYKHSDSSKHSYVSLALLHVK